MVGGALAFFLLEFAFVMLTAILSQGSLGRLAWVRILGGNAVGATLTLLILWRRHPLAQEFRDGTAEGEQRPWDPRPHSAVPPLAHYPRPRPRRMCRPLSAIDP